MTSINFRRDVQGLRGVAVLLVVLYHSGAPLHGGFIGVDVFFVISGFVIGGSLLGELHATGRVSLTRFYARRIRRLLPALAAMLMFVSTVGLLFAPVGSVQVTTRTAIAASSLLANVYLSQVANGYFAPAAEWNPLLHTWSLSVEEQFYLVFPVLIVVAFVVGRRLGRPLFALASTLLLIGVASFAVSELWLAGKLEFGVPAERLAFFMMPSRAWEFIAGLLLAVLVRSRRWRSVPPIVASSAGLGGAVAVAASAALLSSDSRFPGLYAMPAVFGTALLIISGTDVAGWTNRVLTCRPLVYLGDVSYSWYLWHWPLIVFARALWPSASPVVTGAVAALASLPIAHGAYQIVEQPIRRARRWERRNVVALGAACIAVPVLGAGSVAALEDRLPSGDYASATRLDLTDKRCDDPAPLGERPSGSCLWGSFGANYAAILIGDSNIRQFADAAVGATDGADWQVEIITLSGCPFLTVEFRLGGLQQNDCTNFVVGSIEALARQPRDLVVISLTERYFGIRNLELRNSDGSWSGVGANRDALFVAAFSDSLTQLRDAGSDVVVIQPVPKPIRFEPRQCSRLLWLIDGAGCRSSAPRAEVIAQSTRAWSAISEAAARADVTVLDLFDDFCPGDPCRTDRDGVLLYRDKGHISAAAAESLAPRFAELFESFEG